MGADSKLLLKHHPNVVSRTIAERVVAIPVCGNMADMESIYTFNDVATLLWRHLQQPTDVSGLVEQVVNNFEVEADEASADVRSFLATLTDAGLVEHVTTER